MSSTNRSYFTLAPLFLVLVIDMIGVGIAIPILSPLFMAADGGVLVNASVAQRNFWYGFTMTSFSFFMFFGAPFLGDLSDYLGRKKVLILCLIGTALGYIISAIGISEHSLFWLIAGRCMAGFLAGSQPIAQAAIADISTAENKMTNMSFMILANCIGFILGPIVGGYFANSQLSSWFNYATPFYVAALLAAINAGLLQFTLRETYQPVAGKKLQISKGLTSFIAAFALHDIRCFSSVLLATQTAFAIYFCYISIFFVQTYHYNTTLIGYFMAYFGLVSVVTFTLIARLANKYLSLQKLVVIMVTLTFIGSLVTLMPSQLSKWLAVILLSIGNGLSYTGLLALMSNSADKNSQGRVMGIAGAVIAAAWSFGGILAGMLGAINLYLPFILMASLLLFGLVFFSSLRKKSVATSIN